MTNKLVGFLEAAGHDFKNGLMHIVPYTLPIIEGAGSVAISIFAPELGPLFNQVVAAVVTAEQSSAAQGKTKAGAEKLSTVVQLVGPLIKAVLADLGKANDDAAVSEYVNAVVSILNAIPTSPQLSS